MLAQEGHGRVNSCPSQNVRRQDRRRKSLFQPGTSRLETCKNLPKKTLEKQPFRVRKVRFEQLQRARPTQPQGRDVPQWIWTVDTKGLLHSGAPMKKMGSVFWGSCHCHVKKKTLPACTQHTLREANFPPEINPQVGLYSYLVFAGLLW